MEKTRYKKKDVIDFNPCNWNFRRSSGYAGYDHIDTPGDEQSWIYESDYNDRRRLKEQYQDEFEFLKDFLAAQYSNEILNEFSYSASILLIHEFLDNRYFNKD